MSSTNLASIEEAIFEFQAYNYTLVAAFTLMVYDTLLNFPCEITFIWGGKFRLAALLYVMTRYGNILQRLVNIYINNAGFNSLASEQLCNNLALLMNSLSMVGWFGVHGLVIIQTYAICHRRRIVLISLGLLALAALTPEIFILLISTCSVEGQVSSAVLLDDTINSILEIVLATVIFAVTLHQVLRTWQLRKGFKSTDKNSLTYLLAQQGVLHYMFLLAFELGTAVFNRILPNPLSSMLNPMWYSLNAIIVCHFLLNIRMTTAHPNGTTHTTLPHSSLHWQVAHTQHDSDHMASEFSNVIFNRSFGLLQPSIEEFEAEEIYTRTVRTVDLTDFPWASGDIGAFVYN